MIPDPDPADTAHLPPDSRDPRKIPAADQMCFEEGETGKTYALYNHDRCSPQSQQPDPDDPDSEVVDQKPAEGFGQEQGVQANDSVREGGRREGEGRHREGGKREAVVGK